MAGVKVPENDIEAQAIAWAMRCEDSDLPAEDQQRLNAWLGNDPRHLGAFVRAQAISADVERVVAISGGTDAALPHPRWFSGLRSAANFKVVAVASVLVLLTIVVSNMSYHHFSGRVATTHGEVRRIELADGSVLFLDSDSVAQVRYGHQRREIVLRKGEALFRVAKDSLHPFVVSAGDIAATAVGTVFSVSLKDDAVAVTVSEGAVRVDDPDRGAAPELVRANEQLVSSSTGARRVNFDGAEIARRLAWQDRRLVFNGQQLGTAAKEVSRYARIPVIVDDAKLSRAEFFGEFNVGDARAFAAAAAAAFDGRVVEEQDGLHIQRAPNAPSH